MILNQLSINKCHLHTSCSKWVIFLIFLKFKILFPSPGHNIGTMNNKLRVVEFISHEMERYKKYCVMSILLIHPTSKRFNGTAFQMLLFWLNDTRDGFKEPKVV